MATPETGALSVLIVEDYPAIARSLDRELRSILGDRVKSLVIVTDVGAARDHLAEHPVDLMLLDLRLGGEDGFSVLQWATGGSAHTIVVSAHTERAIEAFEHGVLDFVPKPVRRERLRQAVARFDSTAERGGSLRILSVRTRDGFEPVPVDGIRRVQAAGKYSSLHLVDGRERIHDKTLERLESLLPERFMRVHRSHIVHLERVERLVVQGGGNYRLDLEGGESVPVGRTYYPEVRGRLGQD